MRLCEPWSVRVRDRAPATRRDSLSERERQGERQSECACECVCTCECVYVTVCACVLLRPLLVLSLAARVITCKGLFVFQVSPPFLKHESESHSFFLLLILRFAAVRHVRGRLCVCVFVC